MGISSDGILCFGVQIEEETELPWNAEKYQDVDMEDWWNEMCGYTPLFQLYDEHGEYLNGEKPEAERINEYYAHRRLFINEHPMPVDVVLHCSYSYSMYIIGVKGTEINANRGYPVAVDPLKLTITQEQINTILKFCSDHNIEYEGEPSWWLASLYG